MRPRELFSGALILLIFVVVLANVSESNELAYLIYSGDEDVEPDIQISDNLSLTQNSTGKVEASIEDAEKASYTGNTSLESVEAHPDYNITPRPRSVLQSLPPYWRWDKVVAEIDVVLEFNTTEMDEGDYEYSLEAWNRESYSNETFRVEVE